MKSTSIGQKGYVALLAILVIGAASVTIASALLLTGTDRQRETLLQQQSAQARGLASACAEEALQQLQASQSYTGTNSLTLGQGSCTYTVTNPGGTTRTISTAGTVQNVVIKNALSVTIGASSISIISWQDSQ